MRQTPNLFVGGLLVLFTQLSALSFCERSLAAEETVKQETESVNVSDGKAQTSPSRQVANRLARESSPYLLMHAHNPVNWFAWGPEAFEKARKEDKPIFLSIGYSSCYWCHVMEREAFSSEKVAEFLNQHFVCIKVDREERPDVDDIYMTSLIVYLQAAGSGGSGGWPLSMFLTADGEPIAGATYLPAEDTPDGRTGFLTAAMRIHDLWKNNRPSITSTSSMIAREVRRLSGPSVLAEPTELNHERLKEVSDDIIRRYDPVHGGIDFNPRNPDGPRFPNVPRLMFLLSLHEETADTELLKIVDHSLTAMAKGGIRDHLGGGFHRYSTDRHWNVPHFEKMLYDQAQLLEVYAHAARVTQNPNYLEVIDELVGFLRREMMLPDGGFCSALDAETNAIEGEFYAWTEAEIRAALKADDAELFLRAYGFSEPQSFEHGRVLFLPETVERLAETRSVDSALLKAQLASIRTQLLKTRSQRPRPFLDDKVLLEWNALMIQGLSVSGRLPGRESDLHLATRAANFLLTQLTDADGKLMRSWRNGSSGQRAFLDDYACLISALIELYNSTEDVQWLTKAGELMTQQIELFYDDAHKTFFFTAHDQEKLFARSSSPYDSVSPSGNSMTIRNLLNLSRLQRKPHFQSLAEATLLRFSSAFEASPGSCSGLALALQDLLRLKSSNSAAIRAAGRTRLTSLPTSIDEAPSDEEQSAKVPAAEGEQSAFKPVLEPVNPSPLQRQDGERRVTAKIYPYFDKLERGGKCPVAIELTIAKDWHINANPASPDFLIPTEVKIKSSQKVKMTKIKYPDHETLEVEGQDEPSHVYGGKVIIYALLEIDPQELSEKAELEVEIKYQACNSKTCEAPASIKLKGKLPLADSGDDIKKINADKFPKPEDKKSEKSDEEQ